MRPGLAHFLKVSSLGNSEMLRSKNKTLKYNFIFHFKTTNAFGF